MSKLLVISYSYPKPDESSGDLRFFTLLSLLASKHEILFCALDGHGAIQPYTDASNQLQAKGITLGKVNLPSVLKSFEPDIVIFEFYHQVREDFIVLLDRYCPNAKLVVDSVDIHFKRLEARAKLTGTSQDWSAAQKMKELELKAYAAADLVIAVSNEDKELLNRVLPDLPVEVVPNIHAVPPFTERYKRQFGELIFVGGFRHDPNVDAVVYFCNEVMPKIISAYPQVILKILGSNMPQEVINLANTNVHIVGYVPSTAPYLTSAFISIAPLRYGGGMKGKVGEAMSYGLPVVTTSFGAEGFGLAHGEHILIGDDASSFSEHVLSLLSNEALYDRIAHNGYQFIKRNYSVDAVAALLDPLLDKINQLPTRSIPFQRTLMLNMKAWYQRNIAWRLKRP